MKMKKLKLTGIILSLLLAMAAVLPACAEDSASGTSKEIPEERQYARLSDTADVLSDAEEAEVLSKLDEISERQQFDVVIVCLDSLQGEDIQDAADDLFDYGGFGYGEDHDGTLLLVSIEDRKWHVSTCGYGITALTDAGIEYLAEQFLPDMSDGNYKDSFITFADTCDELVTQAKEGTPYDVTSKKSGGVNRAWILRSLVIGFLLASFPMSAMKKKMKNVRMQAAASGYVQDGSQNITKRSDMFLYRTVDRTRKSDDEDGKGGSTTHTSSSGTSHGGGGGSF